MAEVLIYTSRNCGWAVRNYAALIEKGVDFDAVPAKDDDGNKLDEFLALTPYGKTPVLSDDDVAVFESHLINEYIEEQYPDPPLLPRDPASRSVARKWTHYCEHSLLPALSTMAGAPDALTRGSAVDRFTERLEWFATNGMPERWLGPYYFGERFSLLDLVFATLFQTMREIEQTLPINLPLQNDVMERWAENVLARPSLSSALAVRDGLEF